MNVLSNLQRIHSGARAFLVRGLKCASLALLVAVCVPASNVQAEETTKTPLAKADKIKLEAMLTSHLQDIVDRQRRLEGQGRYIKVKSVNYDVNEGIINIDLGKSYVPRHYGIEFLDSLRDMNLEITDLIWDSIPGFNGVRFLYDGKDVYYYFPDEPHEPPVSKTAVPNVVGQGC